jgi:hypothetical protein
VSLPALARVLRRCGFSFSFLILQFQLADGVIKQLPSKDVDLPAMLEAVWSDQDIYNQCPGLIIRLASLRGNVAGHIWEVLGNNPDDVQVLAIGSVAIPEHLKAFHKALDYFWTKTNTLETEFRGQGHNYTIGYIYLP